MKKSLLFLFLFSICLVSAQVKIGENPSTIDPASILELESTSRVLVITRVTTAEMEALNPLEGAVVYNEDESCIFYYDGADWNNLCSGDGVGSIRAAVWGEITGAIADQVDLAGEFAKYVDLTTVQTIAGEKTFTEKITVNTGNTNDQIAEFLGRVKGEEGTAPEDFVTKAQLDASGGGTPAWGAITGILNNQTDLATELANYVDVTNAQSIAGEKTLTDKLTVNTGNITDQAAEFLGRVKGEDGTADDDFVTKLQLDAVSVGGHTGSEGSIFFADDTNQPAENNLQLHWDNTNQRLGVGTDQPHSSIHVQGSFATQVDFIGGAILLDETHHTIFLNGNTDVFMSAANTTPGRMYIIKKAPDVNVNISYLDRDGVFVTSMTENILWIQSDGFTWQQIN